MRVGSRGIFALVIVGGYVLWRNRFELQRRLESFGIRTPLLRTGGEELVRSAAAKVRGKMAYGARVAERNLNRYARNP